MRIENCPVCKEDFGHHGGPFIQCTHCGHVVKSVWKSKDRPAPLTARQRHGRGDPDDIRIRDRDYSGDPTELNFE